MRAKFCFFKLLESHFGSSGRLGAKLWIFNLLEPVVCFSGPLWELGVPDFVVVLPLGFWLSLRQILAFLSLEQTNVDL